MNEDRSFHIEGSPTPEEEKAVLQAVELMLRQEEDRQQSSAWKYAGRGGGRRLGITELRHRLRARAWQLSGRFSWSSQAPDDFRGRGEAK